MPGAGPQGFLVGDLVVVNPREKVVPLHGGPGEEAVDLSGARAQLLELHAQRGWLVLTFDGLAAYVAADCVRPLADEFGGLGLDAVLGPASDLAGLAPHLAATLGEKGHVVAAHIGLPAAQRAAIFEAVTELDQDGLLQRLPAAFEFGYLGRGGRAKVALVDVLEWDAKNQQLADAVQAQGVALAQLSGLLSPEVQESLGFSFHSQTDLMLRMPFDGSEDAERYPAPEADEREADKFLALMGRRRLCALHCLGPAASNLRLIPRAPEFAEVILRVVPGSLVLFLTDFYDYEYEAEGATLTLQSFFLERPLEFTLQSRIGTELSPEELPPPTGPGLPAGEPVCVTGMASRDPCEVDDHEKLWIALRHAGCDGAQEIPHTRFDVDMYIYYEDQALAIQRNQSYCRHQGHIDGIEIFDSAFFNVPAQEAAGMDPEQRIVLETGWLAMAEAGFSRKAVQKDSAHIGIFVGISGSDWRDVCPIGTANGVPETFIANRFSYVVNLKGPSFISNTACSASLVATHTAKLHLLFPTDPLAGALVVGVSLNTSPGTWCGNCAGSMLSFGGRSFSFNSTADGYGRGEGCAAAVIRRCEYDPTDPLTAALLAGSHTNSDGRSASLTAPNGPAQQRLLRAILTETELDPSEICVYEAHGTGTSLGDPIEVGAVRKVLIKREHPLMVSCSKTNLGHLEGGAGLSSFCKCVMACMHTECAPNQHLKNLNPHMDIDGWPALLLTEAGTMRGDTAYVGVSGFGYGGTNSHSMLYGRNVVTSRGQANPKFIEQALFRKVKGALPPEINMLSENYEEWATSGVPHLNRDPRANFSVEVSEEGRLVWRQVLEPNLAEASAFQIQGSFSQWEMLSFESSDEEPGLWWFEVVISGSGQEVFQVTVEHDPYMVLYPDEVLCDRQAARLQGPAPAPSRDHAWAIRGEAGARYRIELFQSGSTAAVTWRRCRDEAAGALMEHDHIQE